MLSLSLPSLALPIEGKESGQHPSPAVRPAPPAPKPSWQGRESTPLFSEVPGPPRPPLRCSGPCRGHIQLLTGNNGHRGFSEWIPEPGCPISILPLTYYREGGSAAPPFHTLNFMAKKHRSSEVSQCPSCTPKYIKEKTDFHIFESYTWRFPGPPFPSWSCPTTMKDEGRRGAHRGVHLPSH